MQPQLAWCRHIIILKRSIKKHLPVHIGDDLVHIFVEHQPIGNTATDSTILTHIGSASLRARMDFLCSETMHDLLVSLKQTTFTITDPWSNSVSWYLQRVESKHAPWYSASEEKFFVTAFLVGR